MKKYFILAAAAIAMASCSNDEGANVAANDGTIRIATDLGKGGTRTIDQTVQATQIANGGKVWVEFTTNADASDINQGAGDAAGLWNTGTKKASALYTADGSGNLSSATPTKWPKAGATNTDPETVTIEAWAPFTEKPTIGNQFTVQADQSTEANYVASDYLYGTRAAFGYSAIASSVLVTFDHKLAKINVKVSNADGSSVSGAKVVFGPSDLDRDAQLKANGAVDATGGSATGAITMATALDANATASCIIIPQSLDANDDLFTITLGSDTYTCQTSSARTFDPTKVYTFNLSLSDGKTIVLSEQINDWTSGGEAESVIAKQNP